MTLIDSRLSLKKLELGGKRNYKLAIVIFWISIVYFLRDYVVLTATLPLKTIKDVQIFSKDFFDGKIKLKDYIADIELDNLLPTPVSDDFI